MGWGVRSRGGRIQGWSFASTPPKTDIRRGKDMFKRVWYMDWWASGIIPGMRCEGKSTESVVRMVEQQQGSDSKTNIDRHGESDQTENQRLRYEDRHRGRHRAETVSE
eukprot:755376-Hanusia_phi.AAC.3